MPTCLFVDIFLSSTGVRCLCGCLRIKQQLVSSVVMVAAVETQKKTKHLESEKFLFPDAGCGDSRRLRLHGKQNEMENQHLRYRVVLISSCCGRVPEIVIRINYSPARLLVTRLETHRRRAANWLQRRRLPSFPVLVVCQRNRRDFHFQLPAALKCLFACAYFTFLCIKNSAEWLRRPKGNWRLMTP